MVGYDTIMHLAQKIESSLVLQRSHLVSLQDSFTTHLCEYANSKLAQSPFSIANILAEYHTQPPRQILTLTIDYDSDIEATGYLALLDVVAASQNAHLLYQASCMLELKEHVQEKSDRTILVDENKIHTTYTLHQIPVLNFPDKIGEICKDLQIIPVK